MSGIEGGSISIADGDKLGQQRGKDKVGQAVGHGEYCSRVSAPGKD